MLEAMKQVAAMDGVLNMEERQLFSAASKYTVGRHRNSWRMICAVEQEEEQKGIAEHIALVLEYRTKEETAIINICRSVIDLVKKQLSIASTSPEYQVYLYKTYIICYYH